VPDHDADKPLAGYVAFDPGIEACLAVVAEYYICCGQYLEWPCRQAGMTFP
jgi:hypothetical protein